MREITVLNDGLGFVKKHPEMFFPGKPPNPLDCLKHLAHEVLALGGIDVAIRYIDGWWLLSSTFDWLAGGQVELVFKRIVPLPEVGVNSSYVEVVLVAFAESVATFGASDGRRVVSGEGPSEDVWKEMTSATRSVSFRFA